MEIEKVDVITDIPGSKYRFGRSAPCERAQVAMLNGARYDRADRKELLSDISAYIFSIPTRCQDTSARCSS